MRFSENPQRSFVKTLTYRLIIFIADFIVIYAVTRRFDITTTAALLANAIKMLLYYFHERIWNSITWGRFKNR